MSKSGLKLKVDMETVDSRIQQRQQRTKPVEKLSQQFGSSSQKTRRRFGAKKQSDEGKLPLLGDRSNMSESKPDSKRNALARVKNPIRRQGAAARNYGSKCTSDENKENSSDNSGPPPANEDHTVS